MKFFEKLRLQSLAGSINYTLGNWYTGGPLWGSKILTIISVSFLQQGH